MYSPDSIDGRDIGPPLSGPGSALAPRPVSFAETLSLAKRRSLAHFTLFSSPVMSAARDSHLRGVRSAGPAAARPREPDRLDPRTR